MRHHILHQRLHLLQVGESRFHLIVKRDAERVDGEVLEVVDRIGIAEVAAEEHAVAVLDSHQLVLEVGGIEVEEDLLVAVELEVDRF